MRSFGYFSTPFKNQFHPSAAQFFWYINTLSVSYLLNEIRLKMNREAVIEIGLSGLIPMDLEA